MRPLLSPSRSFPTRSCRAICWFDSRHSFSHKNEHYFLSCVNSSSRRMISSFSTTKRNSLVKPVWMLFLLVASPRPPSRRGLMMAHAFLPAAASRRIHPRTASVAASSYHQQQGQPRSFISGQWKTYVTAQGPNAVFSAMTARDPRLITTTRLFASSGNNYNTQDNHADWKVPDTIHVPEESLDLSFIRSSGSGGQNVNKVNTQVQIKVLIDAMGWVPYEVRERLRQQQANRINKEGYLVLQVQEHRTQPQNRKAAIQKLREMILQAWPRPKERNMRTGISAKTKKKRKEDKRKRKFVKENRRRVEF